MMKRFFVVIALLATSATFAQQKKEKQPPPPPPKVNLEKFVPPPPPPKPTEPPPPSKENMDLPKDYQEFLKRNPAIKNIGWGKNEVRIRLKSGKVEVYDLNNEGQAEELKNKYGELPAAPPKVNLEKFVPPPPPPPKPSKVKTQS